MTRPVMNRTLAIVLGAWLIALIPTWLSVKSAGGYDASHWLADLVMWISFATMAIGIAFLTRILRNGGRHTHFSNRMPFTRSQGVVASILAVGIVTWVAYAFLTRPHEPGFWARASLFASLLCNASLTLLLAMARRSGSAQPGQRADSLRGNQPRGIERLAAEPEVRGSIAPQSETHGGRA
jgi:hypothetical protein